MSEIAASRTTNSELRRVGLALGLILLINLPGLIQVSSPHSIREDGDTGKMLDEIRASGGLAGAVRWFSGDWMLENHFYRPVTGLSMSIDYALYGERGWGYRLTNWLLSVLTAFGVYFCLRWFARWACFEPPALTAVPLSASLAFSLQQTGWMHLFGVISEWWLVLAAMLLSLFIQRRQNRFIDPPPSASTLSLLLPVWLAAGAILWGWDRLTGFEFLRMIAWVPSRTALLMTCFALWSIVCLCRAGDTRSWKPLLSGWGLFALAQGAYEQTITLVPLIGLLTWMNRKEWGRWAWGMGAGTVCIALLYLSLRFLLVPAELSGYQQQQLRSSRSGWAVSVATELFPVSAQWLYWRSLGFEPALFLFAEPWHFLLMLLAYAGVIYAFTRQSRWFGACLLWQFFTFLPMSFLHPFEHYHYLPQIGRNALDIGLLWLGVNALVLKFPPLARRILAQAHRQSSVSPEDE